MMMIRFDSVVFLIFNMIISIILGLGWSNLKDWSNLTHEGYVIKQL